LYRIAASQYGGHLYIVMSNASSYTAAQQAAASMTYNGWPAYLATIDSADEYQYLSWVLRARNAYVSGSDASSEGIWVLTDGPNAGQTLPFLPWTYGEPSGGTGQNCLALAGTDGLLSVNCSAGNMDYVVEIIRMMFGIHKC
jgi:hypothetical protein